MKYQICESLWSKTRGLMFSKKKNLVFVFDEEKRISLHMMFVFFPIDVLFLDKDKKTIEVKKDFKPFSFYTPKEKARYVIEIAENRRNDYKIGEKIDF